MKYIFSLKPHPYSQIFPNEMAKFPELVASVKRLGRLRYPVIIHQNMILDGNQRLRACKIANVEPKHIEFKGTDAEALELVWDLNWNRRHLTESQRAVAFAQYCTFADSGTPVAKGSPGTPLAEAAAKVGVGEKTMQRAKKVVAHGTKEEIESIRSGRDSVRNVACAISERLRVRDNGDDPVDDMGYPVPKPAQAFWFRKGEAEEILASLRAVKRKVNALDKNDSMWIEVNLGGVLGDLESAINRWRGAIPAYVCAHCNGEKPAKCQACHGRGVVSEFFWKYAVPEELRKMRERSTKMKSD